MRCCCVGFSFYNTNTQTAFISSIVSDVNAFTESFEAFTFVACRKKGVRACGGFSRANVGLPTRDSQDIKHIDTICKALHSKPPDLYML